MPPRVRTESPAKYPNQALYDRFGASVTVVLVLEIDREGLVRKVSVEAPRGHGFDEAAIEAAEKLVFEPAQKNGSPVAARIQYRYVFEPPAPRLVGRVTAQSTDAPIAGARVTVRGGDGVERTAETSADGTWQVPDVPVGPVRVQIDADGHLAQAADEELAPGEETNIVLRLASSDTQAPDAAAEGPALEVTVKGDRPPREVTKRSLSQEEIEHIPGTNGDALRSLQNLPGVARPPPFAGLLVVRGSAPDDTKVFVDGTGVPLVYHFGGLSSVVPSELLEKIDFYPGNYSAVYGRGIGGMVDVGIRKPKKDAIHGMAQVDLIDTRLIVEGPMGRTGWSFLAAGRRSWFDAWLGPALAAADAGATTAPRYYDYQLELQNDLTKRSSFRLLFFGANDALELLNQSPSASAPTFGGRFGAHTSFWRLQARYENKISDDTEVRATAAYGEDSVDIGFGTNFVGTTVHPLSLRAEVGHKVVRGLNANVGLDILYEPYDLHLRLPPVRRPGVPSGGPGEASIDSASSGTRFLPGAYTELEITPWRGTRIVPGFRADHNSETKSWDLSPRINGRQDLTSGFPRTTIKGGVGLFHQPPSPLETDPRFGRSGLSSNRSIHTDVGLEQELTRQITVSVDSFYKVLDRLVTAGSGNSGDGYAYGTEWLLRYKPDDRFFGWIAYTLSRSERRDLPSEPRRLFEYDQTHILTAVGSYKLGRDWRVGGRFRLVSGGLYTPDSVGAFDATVGSQLSVAAVPPNGERFPMFHQLDVRIDKTWSFAAWKLSAYLDVQNVYYAKNVEGISYNYNFTRSSYALGLPILPSIGLRGEL